MDSISELMLMYPENVGIMYIEYKQETDFTFSEIIVNSLVNKSKLFNAIIRNNENNNITNTNNICN